MFYGQVTVKIDNEIIYELDIFAKNDIPKKGIWDYYRDFLCSFNKFLLKGLAISNNP